MPFDATPPGSDPVLQRLIEGRDRLLAKGLAKHIQVDPKTGSVCANGAILAEEFYWERMNPTESPYSHARWREPIWEAAHECLNAQTPDGYVFAAAYNNAEKTTLEDVVRLFDRAIEVRRNTILVGGKDA